MVGVLRIERDAGLLSNQQMALEIGVGLAHLTGRRLSMPFDHTIGAAPASPLEDDARQTASLADLFEIPVPIVHTDEWAELDGLPRLHLDWDDYGKRVCVVGDIDPDDDVLRDFANGRTDLVEIPMTNDPIIDIAGRPLSMASYFFYADAPTTRGLRALLRGVRPRQPYREFAADMATGLRHFNAVHIRRSDILEGIPAYKGVTAEAIAETVSALLPADEQLLICTEASEEDPVFRPLTQRFRNVVFANSLIADTHGERFRSLPRRDDNVLGLLTQEVAARSDRFVGTMGSTFTAMIQRKRLANNPAAPFLYTADYTPPGPVFRDGQFCEVQEGCYSWNRIALAMSPDVLAWFREWPEAA